MKENRRRRKGAKDKKCFEKIMIKNFLKLERRKDMEIQEVQGVPIKMNPKRPTPRHSLIKMAKCKDKENLKGSKGETASSKQGSSNKAIS